MKGKHFLYICIVLKVAIKCLTNFLFCLGEPKKNHKKELFYGENLLCKRVRFHSNWGKQQQIQCLSAGVLKNSRVTLRGTFVCEAYPILLIVGAYCLAWQQTMNRIYREYLRMLFLLGIFGRTTLILLNYQSQLYTQKFTKWLIDFVQH